MTGTACAAPRSAGRRSRAAAVAAAVLAAVSVLSGQQAPTFTSRVEAVRVDVLVTERGQPVRGLKPADFEVIDNGVPSRWTLPPSTRFRSMSSSRSTSAAACWASRSPS